MGKKCIFITTVDQKYIQNTSLLMKWKNRIHIMEFQNMRHIFKNTFLPIMKRNATCKITLHDIENTYIKLTEINYITVYTFKRISCT
jgi:hypothetical protein